MKTIRLRVNGQPVIREVPDNRLLVDFLRYDLNLTGTKEGCSVGVCGACTVLLDGQPASSCIALAVMADGCKVITIEGLAHADPNQDTPPALMALDAQVRLRSQQRAREVSICKFFTGYYETIMEPRTNSSPQWSSLRSQLTAALPLSNFCHRRMMTTPR